MTERYMAGSDDEKRLSRRKVLIGSALGAAALPMASAAGAAPVAPDATHDVRASIDVDLHVNASRHRLTLDPRTTLLEALRDNLGLTGSKKGCDHGQCGACTVLVGGTRILGCLTLAATVRESVTTIEGMAHPDGSLHPMQQAFIDHDAFQCGYCTPGQILSAVACVAEGHARSDADIREYMSGNLCRCAAYPHIVSAIAQAAGVMSAPTPARG